MNFISKPKVKIYYKRHFGEDYTDFDHIYGLLDNLDKGVLYLDKDELSEHGKYYAKTTAKEIRNAIKMLGGL